MEPAADETAAVRHIIVIGAGVAGLQVCRALCQSFKVTVVEAEPDVGGVWSRNQTGFGLQVPFSFFQFPDFPCPPELTPTSPYASGPEVQAYIQAYCDKFGLRRYISFNTQLVSLSHSTKRKSSRGLDSSGSQGKASGGGGHESNMWGNWVAVVEDVTSGTRTSMHADYVVVCTGLFSTPFMPTYEGMSSFQGVCMHSRDTADLEFARDRHVVVVGAGKTGWELVSKIGVASVAQSVTILYRRSHWMLPRSLPDGSSMVNLLYSRHSADMMPPYYTAGFAQRTKLKLLKPFVKLFWKRLEQGVLKHMSQCGMPEPQGPLKQDLCYGGQIVDETWHKAATADSKVVVKNGTIKRVAPYGVHLDTGEELPCDVILFCTGYHNDYRFLSGEIRGQLGIQEDGLYLYRNILPPRFPGLAFVGAEVATFNNILTGGLQAQWLKRALLGSFKIPGRAGMEADVLALRRWRRTHMPASRNRSSVYMLYMGCYHDQLMADMGKRTGSTKWKEPVRPSHYSCLFKGLPDGPFEESSGGQAGAGSSPKSNAGKARGVTPQQHNAPLPEHASANATPQAQAPGSTPPWESARGSQASSGPSTSPLPHHFPDPPAGRTFSTITNGTSGYAVSHSSSATAATGDPLGRQLSGSAPHQHAASHTSSAGRPPRSKGPTVETKARVFSEQHVSHLVVQGSDTGSPRSNLGSTVASPLFSRHSALTPGPEPLSPQIDRTRSASTMPSVSAAASRRHSMVDRTGSRADVDDLRQLVPALSNMAEADALAALTR